ncbi:MAG: T9SS C-terminal target domain-containing protein [Bacteroidetes bacterium]|nr:MAG: T9SS C-terminal target domain-containing protein [Bacteroidota bacterium]
MKKYFLSFFTISILGIVYSLFTNDGTAYSSSGGAPGSGSCATSSCHSGTLQTSDNFEIDVLNEDGELVTSYVAGATYFIGITWNNNQAEKIGFALSANGGTLLADPADNSYKIVNGYATHTLSGAAANGTEKSWIIEWVAPTSGTINFTAYLNVSNNNNSRTGDIIYQKTASLNPAPTGLSETSSVKSLSVYPNPVGDNLNLSFDLKEKSSVKLSILSLDGKLVKALTEEEMDAGKQNLSFGMDLTKGIYLLHLSANKQVITKRIMVK